MNHQKSINYFLITSFIFFFFCCHQKVNSQNQSSSDDDLVKTCVLNEEMNSFVCRPTSNNLHPVEAERIACNSDADCESMSICVANNQCKEVLVGQITDSANVIPCESTDDCLSEYYYRKCIVKNDVINDPGQKESIKTIGCDYVLKQTGTEQDECTSETIEEACSEELSNLFSYHTECRFDNCVYVEDNKSNNPSMLEILLLLNRNQCQIGQDSCVSIKKCQKGKCENVDITLVHSKLDIIEDVSSLEIYENFNSQHADIEGGLLSINLALPLALGEERAELLDRKAELKNQSRVLLEENEDLVRILGPFEAFYTKYSGYRDWPDCSSSADCMINKCIVFEKDENNQPKAAICEPKPKESKNDVSDCETADNCIEEEIGENYYYQCHAGYCGKFRRVEGDLVDSSKSCHNDDKRCYHFGCTNRGTCAEVPNPNGLPAEFYMTCQYRSQCGKKKCGIDSNGKPTCKIEPGELGKDECVNATDPVCNSSESSDKGGGVSNSSETSNESEGINSSSETSNKSEGTNNSSETSNDSEGTNNSSEN